MLGQRQAPAAVPWHLDRADAHGLGHQAQRVRDFHDVGHLVLDAFVENLAEKVHNLGADTLKVALSNTAPASSNTVMSDITQIGAGFVPSRCASLMWTWNSLSLNSYNGLM